MKAVLLVFLGGGLGSILRYLISITLNNSSQSIPYGTFLVNFTGSLILGILFGLSIKSGYVNNNLLLLLGTGFCGGFTTFSSFAYENHMLLKSEEFLSFGFYSLGSVVLGITAVCLGLLLTKFI